MKRLLTIVAALLLTSCAPESPVDYKPLGFAQYQPINIAVSSIQIVEEYKSPMRPPFVEHLIPYSPAEAMKIWTRDRLRSVGGDKTMQVIIKDGAVKATKLPVESGLKGWLTIEQDMQYDASLNVELRVYGTGAMSEASVNVKARRSITMPENASVNTRNLMFRNMIASMMEEVNAELEKNLYQYMGNYISFSQSP